MRSTNSVRGAASGWPKAESMFRKNTNTSHTAIRGVMVSRPASR